MQTEIKSKKEFKHNESYKHKFAKDLLAKWIYDQNKKGGWSFNTLNKQTKEIKYIGGDANRIFVEYPIVYDINDEKHFNSQNCVWDEFYDYKEKSVIDMYNICTPSPTYDFCVEKKLIPKCIFDVATSEKGIINCLFEVVHKNPISDEKLNIINEILSLSNHGGLTIIEIDADWILSQVKIPDTILINKYIN
jgi:hypothetical protein